MASRTQHFKGFSVVRGDIKADVDLSRFEKQFQEAQFYLDSQVMTDMVPLMPMNTHTFINETRAKSESLAGTGIVCAGIGPMGRFLYEGKGMVDEETGSPFARRDARKVLVSRYAGKTNAEENLSYSNPQAVPHWFDEAKKQHLSEWVQGVKQRAGGGRHG